MIGEIIGGIAGISRVVGGFLSRRKQASNEAKNAAAWEHNEAQDKVTTSSIDLKAFRDEAVAAGFNPVFAARVGMWQGFGTTTAKGYDARYAGYAAPSIAGGFFSDAGQAIGAFQQGMLQRAQESRLAAESQARIGSMFPSAPSGILGQSMSVGGGRMSSGNIATGGPIEAGRRTATNPYPVSSGLKVDPDQPDAEMSETRYGEIISNIAGAYIFGRDVWYNYKDAFKAEFKRQFAMPNQSRAFIQFDNMIKESYPNYEKTEILSHPGPQFR
jgi:Sec-independent protein translocase protein TatA